MREVYDHHVHGKLTSVRVFPEGDPGPDGSHDVYTLAVSSPGMDAGARVTLRFQRGDPAEQVNGITNEALLAVVIDRLRGIQNIFSRRENAIALTHAETALMWLLKLTPARRTEGKQNV